MHNGGTSGVFCFFLVMAMRMGIERSGIGSVKRA
jgi:hypothetical protein